jgi:DNA anti-recombination protein RmuC
MSSEVQNGFSLINSKVDALNTQKQLSEDIKQLEKSKGNSLEESAANVANQLNKVKEQARSFQRNIPTSMDQLVNLIGKTKGNSSQTFQYLRRKVLEAMVKMEPKVQEIVITETIKTLGCSQEQSYQAISLP